ANASGSGVTFWESGLPGYLGWGVTLNGAHHTAAPGTPIVVPLANGTYNYSIADVAGWHQTTLAYRGSVVVNGSNVVEPTLVFVQVTYTVTFAEGGLATGVTWAVTIAGTLYFATAPSSVSASLPNGSFTYTISDVPGWHQATLPYTGSGNVSWAPVTEPSLLFTQVAYAVNFNETGLPSGMWAVTISGAVVTAAVGSTITAYQPNGTFAYTVNDYAGYHQTTLPYSGSGTVSGAPVNEPIMVFSQETYSVTFTASGLTNQTWGVTLNGNHTTCAGSGTVTFTTVNGTYNYSIDDVAGWHQTTLAYSGTASVAGRDVIEPTLNFTQFTYSVTFTQTGPGLGGNWSVILGTTPETRTGGPITFTGMPNGTYAFSVSAAGYAASPASGSVTVSGSNATKAIVLTASVPPTYPVTFTESGLPSGATWCVTLNGTFQESTQSSIRFYEPNGTYAYTILNDTRLVIVAPENGSVTIQGASVSKTATISAAPLTITFTETGLPSGTTWSVDLNGTPNSSMGPTVSFSASWTFSHTGPHWWDVSVSCSYQFTVNLVSDFTASPSSGVLRVNMTNHPQNVSQAIAFQPGTSTSFTETGLPSGSIWSVTINGTMHRATAPASILVALGNGTYNYTLSSVESYYAWPYSTGSTTVSGSALAVAVSYEFTYAARFTESGLASGTTWMLQVTNVVTGQALSVQVASDSWFTNSSASAATFPLINGTYSYTVSAGGYNTVTGPLTVAGSAPSRAATFSPSSSSPSSSIAWWIWAIIGAVIVIIIVAVVVLLMGGRKGGGGEDGAAARTSGSEASAPARTATTTQK
ncbi:MAG: hypothetical protein ACREBT_03690, partial [Thermoplasmata archaeon]